MVDLGTVPSGSNRHRFDSTRCRRGRAGRDRQRPPTASREIKGRGGPLATDVDSRTPARGARATGVPSSPSGRRTRDGIAAIPDGPAADEATGVIEDARPARARHGNLPWCPGFHCGILPRRFGRTQPRLVHAECRTRQRSCWAKRRDDARPPTSHRECLMNLFEKQNLTVRRQEVRNDPRGRGLAVSVRWRSDPRP